jgi:hypothetical protein
MQNFFYGLSTGILAGILMITTHPNETLAAPSAA